MFKPLVHVQKLREEKQHKHKLFGPDFLRKSLTLTPGYPGVQKFRPVTGAAGKRTSWCGRPQFSAWSMTRRVLKKLCSEKVCVDFGAPKLRGFTKFFCVPETSEFTKPPGSYEFCGFSFRKNNRKEPRSSVGFCAATGV